jgi:hypothetical protein
MDKLDGLSTLVYNVVEPISKTEKGYLTTEKPKGKSFEEMVNEERRSSKNEKQDQQVQQVHVDSVALFNYFALPFCLKEDKKEEDK